MERIFDGLPDIIKEAIVHHYRVTDLESSRLFELFQEYWTTRALVVPAFDEDLIKTVGSRAALRWLLDRNGDPNKVVIMRGGVVWKTALTNVPSASVALGLLEAGAQYHWILERSYLPHPRVIKACISHDPSFKAKFLNELQLNKIQWDFEWVQLFTDFNMEVPRYIIDSALQSLKPPRVLKTFSEPDRVLEAVGAFFSFGLVKESLLPPQFRQIICCGFRSRTAISRIQPSALESSRVS